MALGGVPQLVISNLQPTKATRRINPRQ